MFDWNSRNIADVWRNVKAETKAFNEGRTNYKTPEWIVRNKEMGNNMDCICIENFKFSAKVDIADESVTITLPNGKTVGPFLLNDFKQHSLFASSHTYNEWTFLHGNANYWESQYLIRDTDELQAMASLLQFSHEILNNNHKTIADFIGKGFRDFLPPRNYLLVPNESLQNKLKENNFFYKNGRVYLCTVRLAEITFRFYFRPYNTSLLHVGQDFPEALSKELQNEYHRILATI